MISRRLLVEATLSPAYSGSGRGPGSHRGRVRFSSNNLHEPRQHRGASQARQRAARVVDEELVELRLSQPGGTTTGYDQPTHPGR